MEVICEDCRAVIQISDERVPTHSTFRLTCPRCQRKIVVSTKTTESLGAGKVTVSPAVASDEGSPPADDIRGKGVAEEMASLQRGQPAALLCLDTDNARGLAQGALQRMGYAVDMPTAVDQALQRLRFNQYQVIVLAEQFGGSSPNPVTEYVTALNMNIRRDIFVALVGERFKTADHLQAFVESVNLVVHPADLTQIQAFLARGLRDHERFYKVFVDCLIESGRRF